MTKSIKCDNKLIEIDGHMDDVTITEIMTDKQIVKNLEYYIDEADGFYASDVLKNALELLKRQRAEIERLRYNLKAVLDERTDHSEAIDEFVDLAIKNIRENVTPIPQQRYLIKMCIEEIENTKKEMVGEMDV